MSQLSSDTIYRDLKQKGLELSPATKITIPESQPIKTGLLKKLSSIVSKPQVISPQPPQLLQIMNSAFIAIRNHSIFIYKYSYNESTRAIQCSHEGTLNLAYEIEEIYTCEAKYIQDRDYPMLIRWKGGFSYLNFDLKDNTIQERGYMKILNMWGAGWINEHQCLVIDDKAVYHYTIAQGVLKQKEKSVKNVTFQIRDGEQFKKLWILANIDEQQDSIISIFYCTVPKTEGEQRYPPIKLKIKQLMRTFDGDIMDPKADYLLETQSLEFRPTFNIISVGEYYCLQLAKQVLIVKKKFDKYMLLDNMMEIMNEYQLKLCRKGIVVSIGEKLLELNCIQFADPKCTSRIIDVIEFPQEMTGYHKYFKNVWPIHNPKEYTLIFVFLNENELTLSGLVKLEPMNKMMALAKRDNKQNLDIIQDMARNLGIERKDFYLKLWSTSKKQNNDIYKFLLPCHDVTSIKKQLKSTLRNRTIQVGEMKKILKEITTINLENLRQNLNQKNLKEYVKNDFLRKKLELSSTDKKLDHRIFEKIYTSSILDIFDDIVREELDPIQPVYDPLHPNLNSQPIKQLKSLKTVIQQFKVVLLQDYKIFLIKFLQKFPDKILKILQKFSFLLPNHPFQIEVQKPSKTNEPNPSVPKTNGTPQQLWFHTVYVSQWEVEITKEKILNNLFHDFQTSKITETIDEFYNSIYGKENKRWKHGLIILSLDQYARKLKSLNGIQLYLDVCQFANELSIKKNGDPKISEQILKILSKENKLCEPDLHFCRLYANMHYFMLKNKIIPVQKLDITYLINLKPENLVAIFFLQNKQRKQHIFNDFKNLYEDKNQFKQILQKFVQSENCSRIELEILMKEVKSKNEEFQKENQDIIEILITGICMKVEIRETLLILDVDDGEDQAQGTEIDDIKLNKVLALKINRVKRLKLCKNIFAAFGLQKMTYKQLLDLQNGNDIFKLILSRYFQLRDTKQPGQFTVSIENQEIDLENPRNLLTVLVYLQENVYYSAKTFDILIIFGLELIQWKEFQVVRSLINDQNALDTLNIDRNEYVEILTIRALDTIYLDGEIVYQDQTRQQIISILNIDDQMSPLKIRQLAKLQIVVIFTEWGLEVHPSDIHTICSLWKDETKAQFIEDLLKSYVDKLDFKNFQEIYRLLEITDQESPEVNLENKQFIKFCDMFAKKLLEKRRFRQAAEIIHFLMKTYREQVQYTMLAQAYIQSVNELFPESLETGRKLIQLFTQSFGTSLQPLISDLLENYFANSETILNIWQQDRSPQIEINSQYCYDNFNKVKCVIKVDDLWTMAEKEAAGNVGDLYYNFFILNMGLINPTIGFREILGISYNLQKVTNLLIGDLNNLIDKDQNLWYICYRAFLFEFTFGGVLDVCAYQLNFVLDGDLKLRSSKSEMVLKELRDYRGQNSKKIEMLATTLNRLKAETLNKNKLISRQERFKKKLREIIEKEKQKEKDKEESLFHIDPIENGEERPERFIEWRKVQESKMYISSHSQYIMSEKDLIDQVFQLDPLQISGLQKKQPPKVVRNNMLPFMHEHNKNQSIISLLKNKKYAAVREYPVQEVTSNIEKMFADNPEMDYLKIYEILNEIQLGDIEKRELFRLARIYLESLPNEIRKTVFPLQFFLQPMPSTSSDPQSTLLYSQLKPYLAKTHSKITTLQIRQLANMMGTILNSAQYSALVYYEQLVYLGREGIFDSATALMTQECIYGMMGSYPDIICQEYKGILDGIRDSELRVFAKEIFIKVLSERQNYLDTAEQVRRYDSHRER